MLLKQAARTTLTLGGWTFRNELPADIKQCVMIAAPHTSNWDALYTKLGFLVMGIPVRITIKDSYMRLPFGPFVRAMGGIGINRRSKKAGEERESMVELMVDLFKTHPELVMLVTPEGTRDLRTKWKTGFYHVAVKAGVPIALGYVDYKHKIVGVGKVVYPSGHMRQDLREIMAFYKDIKGKYPEKFSVDLEHAED